MGYNGRFDSVYRKILVQQCLQDEGELIQQASRYKVHKIISGKQKGAYCLISACRSMIQNIPDGYQFYDVDKQGQSLNAKRNANRNSALAKDLDELWVKYKDGQFTFIKMGGGYKQSHSRQANDYMDVIYDDPQYDVEYKKTLIQKIKVDNGCSSQYAKRLVQNTFSTNKISDLQKKQALHSKQSKKQKSFLVFYSGQRQQQFKQDMIRLGVKYNQDSILYSSSSDQKAYFISTNTGAEGGIGSKTAILGKKMTEPGDYYSRVNHQMFSQPVEQWL